MLAFRPARPNESLGRQLEGLRIHVRDHKKRELQVGDRTLEAHYGDFVFTQSRKGEIEARHWALSVSYGPVPRDLKVAGRGARAYELGPEVDPDDIDGRSPAVVAWHDADMFYLLASDRLSATDLLEIAESVYAQ